MELPPDVIKAIKKYGDLLIKGLPEETTGTCLLYTSDAADE